MVINVPVLILIINRIMIKLFHKYIATLILIIKHIMIKLPHTHVNNTFLIKVNECLSQPRLSNQCTLNLSHIQEQRFFTCQYGNLKKLSPSFNERVTLKYKHISARILQSTLFATDYHLRLSLTITRDCPLPSPVIYCLSQQTLLAAYVIHNHLSLVTVAHNLLSPATYRCCCR